MSENPYGCSRVVAKQGEIRLLPTSGERNVPYRFIATLSTKAAEKHCVISRLLVSANRGRRSTTGWLSLIKTGVAGGILETAWTEVAIRAINRNKGDISDFMTWYPDAVFSM
ncbi:hypothetical protein [Pseudomonas protegens]|uniref:hypothetical protein n=1 Tax=Pseudomonas protegens TaxID=380021 RepID=UPI00383BD203